LLLFLVFQGEWRNKTSIRPQPHSNSLFVCHPPIRHYVVSLLTDPQEPLPLVYPSTLTHIYVLCCATIARRNIRCWVTAGKHVNDIRAIARQQPITTIEKVLESVFSVGSAPRKYSEDPGPAERVQLGNIRRTVTTWVQKLKNLHC
jgi:hypothetical protein